MVAVAVDADFDVGAMGAEGGEQVVGHGDAVGSEAGLGAERVDASDKVWEGGVDGGLAAAEVEDADAAGEEPVDAVGQSGGVGVCAMGRGQAEAAGGVAEAGDAEAEGLG
jgi:hypothetical protein